MVEISVGLVHVRMIPGCVDRVPENHGWPHRSSRDRCDCIDEFVWANINFAGNPSIRKQWIFFAGEPRFSFFERQPVLHYSRPTSCDSPWLFCHSPASLAFSPLQGDRGLIP
jgi:hypothetical protein